MTAVVTIDRAVLPDTDVWRIDLTRNENPRLLSPEERDRAARFRFDRDRVRFERRRAALRVVLATYVDVPPDALEFRTNYYGKPELVNGPQFNASSSGDRAIVVVSAERAVGVDLEAVSETTDETELARQLFAREEVAAIGCRMDFYRCWSRKEAYVKAVGMGLSLPLRSFAVEVRAATAPRLLRSDTRPDDVAQAAMVDLSDPCDHFAASLVQLGCGPLHS